MNARKILNVQQADMAVAAADSSVLGGIFTMFLWQVAQQFLEETGKFFMFPIAAGLNLIRGVLSIREAVLDKGQPGSLTKAIVETSTAVVITTAVVGTFALASVFAFVGPLLFTLAIGMRALTSIGSGIYNTYKAITTKDPDLKKEYKAKAINNFVALAAQTLAIVAVAAVMLLAKPVFAFLGVIAGAIGTALAVYNFFKLRKQTMPLKISPAPTKLKGSMNPPSPSLGPKPSPKPAPTQSQNPQQVVSVPAAATVTTSAKAEPSLTTPLLPDNKVSVVTSALQNNNTATPPAIKTVTSSLSKNSQFPHVTKGLIGKLNYLNEENQRKELLAATTHTNPITQSNRVRFAAPAA